MGFLMDDNTCPTCGGTLAYLGTLGLMVWFRCVNCGAEHMSADATDDEILDDLTREIDADGFYID
jgi:hypothetical protein